MRIFPASLILFITASVCSLNAQVAAGVGAITGSVADPSGGFIENAKVLVENDSLGIHRSVTTGGGGIFNAPALVPAPPR